MWCRGELYIGILWGKLRERDHLEDQIKMGYITKIDLQEINGRAWTGLIWPGRGIGGGLL